MAFIFGKSKLKPAEVLKSTKENLQKIESANDPKKYSEELTRNLAAMKLVLYGDADNEPVTEMVAQLSQEIYNTDILIPMVQQLGKLEFEAKKDVTQVFSHLLRRQLGTRHPTVEYLCTKEQVLFDLIKGYENPDVALTAGMILRECLRHEPLTKIILHNDIFYNFFDYVEMNTFDVAADAFSTFKDVLTKHKSLVAEFLEANYDKFFTKYVVLLNSTNYVTKRQSLKLLGELLLDRSNFNVMTTYISNPENLKLMMNLLRDKSKNIQFEAFHVFKVFVANPNKTKAVLDLLIRNKEKLVTFLGTFHSDRQDDEQFTDEKAFLIKQIQDM